MTIFLSACASTVLNSDTSNLIESENFIAERKEIIAQTVALGPQIIILVGEQAGPVATPPRYVPSSVEALTAPPAAARYSGSAGGAVFSRIAELRETFSFSSGHAASLSSPVARTDRIQ